MRSSLKQQHEIMDEGFQTLNRSELERKNELITQITTVQERLRTNEVTEDQLSNLREDKIRLEEQLKSRTDVDYEVRDAKASAEAREQHLRETVENLMSEVSQIRKDPSSTEIRKLESDHRETIRQWEMRWNKATSSEALNKHMADLSEREVHKLEEERSKLMDQLDTTRTEFRATFQTMQADKDELFALKERIANEYQIQVSSDASVFADCSVC